MYKVSRFFKAIHDVLAGLREALFGFVLHYFKNVNRRIGSKLTAWYMEKETSEHVHSAVEVYKWIILPANLIYVCASFYFLGENMLGPVLWGQLIFFYSNFLPDLPSIYRKKKNDGTTEELKGYKKYAFLLFAPLLIWALFSDIQPRWRTTETFHNFKSLTAYGVFLFLLSLFVYCQFPISIGNVIRILAFPFYGMIGYLAHLKVDKNW
jgi:hypothetical protein